MKDLFLLLFCFICYAVSAVAQSDTVVIDNLNISRFGEKTDRPISYDNKGKAIFSLETKHIDQNTVTYLNFKFLSKEGYVLDSEFCAWDAQYVHVEYPSEKHMGLSMRDVTDIIQTYPNGDNCGLQVFVTYNADNGSKKPNSICLEVFKNLRLYLSARCTYDEQKWHKLNSLLLKYKATLWN